MEKMTNRPCLDMNKAIRLIEEQCKELGADERPYTRLLKSCFIGWYSRSMASSIFVFCKDNNGRWCVLASERGEEALDYQGYWNCPCGYLDFDETTIQCARRECFEETGVNLDVNSLKFVGFEDDPVTANRQNVTFRYISVINNKKTTDFTFSKKNNEGKEVGSIAWIPIEELGNYKWAFGHENRINELFNKYVDSDGSYRFWIDFRKRCSKFFSKVGEIIGAIIDGLSPV
jgi:8-oxo-dGTP pyrophosphatase MutT (NUDIX family)